MTNGNIFGGFAEKPWSSVGTHVIDPRAYIFSLVNREDNPFKVLCSDNGKCAIYCESEYGPTFGGGIDFYIASDSRSNTTSCSTLGFTYKHPDYQLNKDKARNILAGSCKFQTLEIEVFAEAN